MKFSKEVLSNGDLLITADNGARVWLNEQLQHVSVMELWPEFADLLLCNQPYVRFVEPEELAALTSSPILLEVLSEGQDFLEARAWWYPNYQIENELEILKNTGRLVMTMGQEVPADNQKQEVVNV